MWRALQTLLLCSVLTGPQMHVSADILKDPGVFSSTPTDSQNGSFIFPRESDLVFLNRSILDINVTANFEYALILMYQRGGNGPEYYYNNSITIEVNSVSWQPLRISAQDPTLPNEYVLRCVDHVKFLDDVDYNYTHPESFWSPTFKITNNTAEVVSGQSVSVSASPSTTTSVQILPSRTPKSPASTRPSQGESSSIIERPAPKSGLSSSAKRDIILAVILTAAGVAILAGVLFLLRRRHQRQKLAKISPATAVSKAAEVHSYHAVPGQMQESTRASHGGMSEDRVPRVEDLDELVTGRRK